MNPPPVSSIRHNKCRQHIVPAIGRFLVGQHRNIVHAMGVVLLAVTMVQPALAATAPPLGTAANFAVLGATPNVNNTGATVVTGDLGVSPAASVIGFPPGNIIGSMHAADATAATAQVDNTTAYGFLAGQACNVTFAGPTDLAGMTLVPGVYCFSTSAANSGLLKLDAGGNNAAVWIFRTASTLITGSASTVQMINAGQDCNVFWNVGSSATLGTATKFVGNILALTSITLQTGATLSGRALAQTGTVTLASNNVTVCSLLPPPVAVPPTASIGFGAATINAGATTAMTLTFFNANVANTAMSGTLVHMLPAGLVFAAIPNASTSCGGTGAVTAAGGGNALSIGVGRFIPGAGSCTVTVNVLAALPGSFGALIPAGWLQTNQGSNTSPATAALTVNAAVVPTVLPVLSKAFNPASVVVGSVTKLTITLSNADVTAATLTAALVDNLPTGMVVAAVPNTSSTCAGGNLIAVAGSATVTLTAGTAIPANSGCLVSVDLVTQAPGGLLNTLAIGALQTTNGNNTTPAVATLFVSAVIAPTLAPSVGIPTLSQAILGILMLCLALTAPRSLRSRPAVRE